MDLFVFGSTVAAATLWLRRRRPIKERRISHVSSKNTLVEEPTGWCRATYILVMHEPPHLFYEPKEWSHTSVLLLKTAGGQLELPGGNVWQGETYEESAVRQLIQDARIDVCRPENCLHHLFTFPFEFQGKEQHCAIWGDFYECVFRGKIQDLSRPDAVCMSLAEIKDLLEDTSTPKEPFLPDTEYALQLYFQRQGDLRAKRRLLKGYSSLDMAHYGLRSNKPLVLLDFNDDARNAAVDFTMQTDDGMHPKLLHQADIIVLGVSRSGKTPLSIYISQTAGLKVANIPLVFELQPPKELTDDPRIDPRRVFCLTRQVSEMERMRLSRLDRELKGADAHVGKNSTYADCAYIRKDLAKARNLAKNNGYTEIDVTGRALEECASLIISKMKERFPNLHIN